MVLRFRLAKTISGGIMARSEFGGYAAYEDYQKLEAELEALRQQIKAPADDGWIAWGGGQCPVAEDLTVIDAKFRNGDVVRDLAYVWWWSHSGDEDDIIAYRVVK